jgi:hypothetical protein
LLEDRILSNHFFAEIESGESDITENGINFLKEYYGFNCLARILYNNNNVFPADSIKGNEDWLRSLISHY